MILRRRRARSSSRKAGPLQSFIPKSFRVKKRISKLSKIYKFQYKN